MASIDVLRFSQLDDPTVCPTEWDDFIAGVKNGHVFQTTRWAMYKQKEGWCPSLLSFSSRDCLRAVCLVMHRSIAGLPVGGILYVPRGPVLDYCSPEAPRVLSEVLDGLTKLARRRFAVVRLSPDVRQTATWVEEMVLEKGFHRSRQPIQHTSTIRLDLSLSLDHIISEAHRQRRSQIRRYEREKGNWSFSCGDSPEHLGIFFSMYHRTMAAAGKNSKSFYDICLMDAWLAPSGSSFVFIVRHGNRPVAGAVVLAIGKRLWCLYAGSAKGDQAVSGAGVVLQWEIVKWAKGQGYSEYDLGGIPDPSDPGDRTYGLYRFKRAWGGELVRLIGEYDYASYPILGKVLEWKLAHQ